MIAETYLKEKQFVELYTFIQKYIIETDPPVTNIFEELQLQFIQMIFICRVNCPEETPQDISIGDLLQYMKEEYEV